LDSDDVIVIAIAVRIIIIIIIIIISAARPIIARLWQQCHGDVTSQLVSRETEDK